MLRQTIGVAVALLAATGVAWADAGGCLSIWVDTQGEPAECKAVGLREQLDHLPEVCAAESAKNAAIRVKLSGCTEGPKAALPTPATAVIQYVIDAHVTKGEASRELTGRGTKGWTSATADLYRAIVAWSGEQGSSHR